MDTPFNHGSGSNPKSNRIDFQIVVSLWKSRQAIAYQLESHSTFKYEYVVYFYQFLSKQNLVHD